MLPAKSDATMGAPVDENIGVSILVPRDDDRHITDEVPFEITGVGDFATQRNIVPARPSENDVALAGIDVGIAENPCRYTGKSLFRPTMGMRFDLFTSMHCKSMGPTAKSECRRHLCRQVCDV
jgi:hypothetical protein